MPVADPKNNTTEATAAMSEGAALHILICSVPGVNQGAQGFDAVFLYL